MKSRVLITGGAGFIGSKIAEICHKKGMRVRITDLFPPKHKYFHESLEASILDPYEISRAARGCDYVVHAAAALGVNRTETRRLKCLYINIQGTVNVLEAAVKEKVKKVLFLSSSEVYGNQDLDYYREDSPVMPISNYAITKLAGEEYLRAYKGSYGLDYSVVRCFNVYGENQKEEFVVPIFARRIAKGESPLIYGDGTQKRSFCHVEDAARGAVMALLSKKGSGRVFNIGNNTEPISMADLAHRMIALSGKKIKPKFVTYAASDREAKREIFRRVPSIENAKKVLGYKPIVSLNEGLTRVLKFHAKA
jgi:UDP-glucose 4-epimerase